MHMITLFGDDHPAAGVPELLQDLANLGTFEGSYDAVAVTVTMKPGDSDPVTFGVPELSKAFEKILRDVADDPGAIFDSWLVLPTANYIKTGNVNHFNNEEMLEQVLEACMQAAGWQGAL